jgi:hypothetical protein
MQKGNTIYDNLMGQVANAQALTKQLAGLIEANEAYLDQMMGNLPADQKQQLQQVRSKLNRAKILAEKGDMKFVQVIQDVQREVQKMRQNGGNNDRS